MIPITAPICCATEDMVRALRTRQYDEFREEIEDVIRRMKSLDELLSDESIDRGYWKADEWYDELGLHVKGDRDRDMLFWVLAERYKQVMVDGERSLGKKRV